MKKVAVVTGGSSGIGRAIASLFESRGWRVVSFSRREGVDITDPAATSAAVRRVVDEEGQIDVLVNNAGAGVFGAAETTPLEDVRRQMDLNFNAAVALARLVLPHMRSRQSGRIVNVASLAAMFPLPYQSFYSASKAALLAWTVAMNSEIEGFGVRAVAVCPGDVKTDFTSARKVSCAGGGSGAYAPREGRALEKAAASEQSGQSPDVVARCVFSCATAKRPPVVAVPGAGYAWLERASRLLPRTLLARLVSRIYA